MERNLKILIALMLLTVSSYAQFTLPQHGNFYKALGGNGLLNGLIACWEPSNDTVLYDIHNNNDGVVHGASYDIIYNALYYNGSTDYVSIGNVINFNYNEPFSISTWVQKLAYSRNDIIVCKMESSGNYRGYNLYISAAGNYPTFELRCTTSNAISVRSTSSIGRGLYHLVATYDGSGSANGVTIYTNSLQNNNYVIQNNLNDITTNDVNLDIGARNDIPNMYGLIAQTAIWNRTLTAAEVATLCNSGSGIPYINFSAQLKILYDRLLDRKYNIETPYRIAS